MVAKRPSVNVVQDNVRVLDHLVHTVSGEQKLKEECIMIPTSSSRYLRTNHSAKLIQGALAQFMLAEARINKRLFEPCDCHLGTGFVRQAGSR